jgi:hypothetical protein
VNQECPSFERTCCIGNDPILLGEISSFYNKERHYFSVMDEPRLEREDAQNEVIRRNNSIARIRPEVIIYAGLSDESKREFSSRLPSRFVLEINSTEEIDSKLPSSFPREVLHWGQQRLAIGLLLAKQTGRRLKIDLEESPSTFGIMGSSGHAVVLEDRTDIAPIIAANYAYSIGAGLIIIPEVSKDLADEIGEEFYTLYSEEGFEPLEEKMVALRKKLRTLVGEIEYLEFTGGLTFVTSGLPFGFAFNEVPSTHIFAYPDMGVHLPNAIAEEQPNSPGTRVSLLIEPGDFDNSEIKEISDRLWNRGGFVHILAEKGATVFNVHQNIEFYPYDLLVISTHADETSGRRFTYQFTDRHGCQHEITVDEGVGFGYDPATDKFLVSTYERFISLDGVPWHDSEGKSKITNIKVALLDFIEIKKKDIKSLKIIKTKELKRVKGCMALKMFDHNYLPSPHAIADTNSPIVMNNACSSWHELSKRLIFAGARAYIGTMFPITGIEAKEIGIRLFASHLEEPLAFALWQVQNEVYGREMRRPYVMVGPHFTKIRLSQINVPKYLTHRLSISMKRWQKKSESHPEEEIKINAKKAEEFLEKELRKHIIRWYGPKI